MLKYTIKRILIVLPIVLLIIFILFILLYSLTGSRIRNMPIYRNGDVLDSVFTCLNASDNLITKYIRYCFNVLVYSDYGRLTSGRQLSGVLTGGALNTVILLACGAITALLIGIPLGVLSALRKDQMADRIISVVSLIFNSIPNYMTAVIIALFFVLYLGILPMLHVKPTPAMYIMPTLAIALGGISSITRMTRASMIETLKQPYICALRAKGLDNFSVVYRHALKNALIPIISVLSSFISQLLFCSFVVENFFGVFGLGSFMIRSLGVREHYEILGCTVIMTIIIAATAIICDVTYAFLNPQIKLRYSSKHSFIRNREK